MYQKFTDYQWKHASTIIKTAVRYESVAVEIESHDFPNACVSFF